MSDTEKKLPVGQEEVNRPGREEIDWSLYGRAAEAIRSQIAQYGTAEDQPAPVDEPLKAPRTGESEARKTAEEQTEAAAPASAVSANSDRMSKWSEYQKTYYTRPASVPTPEPPVTPPDPPAEDSKEDEPEEQPRRRSTGTGITVLVAILYAVSVLAIAFVTATLGWRWANDMLALNKQELSVSVTIKSGETIHEVAEKLEDYGLVENPFLFELFAAVTNKADNITSGTYKLNTNMDFNALINNMSNNSAAREEVEITIPEGFTVQEIFELLEIKGACTVEQLTQSAMNDEFAYSFLSGLERKDINWLEGYLFPDTYKFYKDGDAKVALSKMLYNYSTKFDSECKTRAERLGYSQREIMIVASIIEKETDGSDQENIASVIYNRLQTSGETAGRLQMDSTIQYGLAERKETLTEADLKLESPYNTYLYTGLPVGPICNPGMESIQAALYPNSTDYYFFMLGNDNTHHFFSTYSEFLDFRDSVQAEQEGGEEEGAEQTNE
ncbi:MAG: endolytic transglycosylase MltG [Oscillospiraceae bacterium]|nr:endolytic transglycosylase MltG [Oscillospiraceae bacterium]